MRLNLLIGGLLILAAWYFKTPALDILGTQDAKNIIGVVVQIAAVMIGFIITAFSVLVTVADKPLLQNMMASRHYTFLLRRLLITTLIFSFAMVSGLYILFTAHPSQLYLCVLFSSLILATVFLIDSGRLLWLVLTNLVPDE